MSAALAAAIASVAAFAVALLLARIGRVAGAATSATAAGLASMLDGALDDRAKERALRRAGAGLILAGLDLSWRLAAALAAAALPILAADATGAASAQAVLAVMTGWAFLVGATAAAGLCAWAMRARKRRRAATARSAGQTASAAQYSGADRLVHALAFAHPAVQRSAAWVENRLVAAGPPAPAGGPVFVTSLARGGTTALLNALSDVPGVATHTYRDMPFPAAPVLSSRLSAGRGRRVGRHLRAHGDGLEIDLDAPEALEEAVWKVFWPEKFAGDTIHLWGSANARPRAERALRRHTGRVVRARMAEQGTPPTAARYCAKNNGHLARLGYLGRVFPDACIVVPVRRPACHAASLHRQHLNFRALQTEDPFLRHYMRDLGHFEFGQLLKPIAFPGFDPGLRAPGTPDFWLAYWIAAFRHVLDHAACHIVLQDDLRAAPQATMETLCAALDLAPCGTDFTGYFHRDADRTDGAIFDPALLAEAEDVYRHLAARCVRPRATETRRTGT